MPLPQTFGPVSELRRRAGAVPLLCTLGHIFDAFVRVSLGFGGLWVNWFGHFKRSIISCDLYLRFRFVRAVVFDVL